MGVRLDKFFDVLINKAHVAIVVMFQGVILVWHKKTGHDLGANVTTTIQWFYGFMAGHFASSQVWPDKKDGQ
jgi:hypothetical protein